jgi:hypothetical protein
MGKGEILKQMFVAFGKPLVGHSMQKRLDLYKDWADNLSEWVLQDIVDKAINYDDRFPSIARMNILKQEVNKNRNTYSDPNAEECYPCGGTGYVPYLVSPDTDIYNTVYHIRNFACKCSKGDVHAKTTISFPVKVRRYFDDYDNLQYQDKRDKYPEYLNYPQLVTAIKTNKNEEYLNLMKE